MIDLSSKFELFVGGVSMEAVLATMKFFATKNRETRVIFSDHQSRLDGGYLGRADHVVEELLRTPSSEGSHGITLGRDHFSPKKETPQELQEYRELLAEYYALGFRHFHVDLGVFEDSAQIANELIPDLREGRLDISLELSLTRDDSSMYLDFLTTLLPQIEDLAIDYLVVPTGSLVRDLQQVGSFDQDGVLRIASWAKKKRVKLKEHNADLLNARQISQRVGLIDSINIAPEMAWLQNSLLLDHAVAKGVDYSKLKETLKADGKWKKWSTQTGIENELCTKIALHYYYNEPTAQRLFREINADAGFNLELEQAFEAVLSRYMGNDTSNQAAAATSIDAKTIM